MGFLLKELQHLFENVETSIRERIEGLPILGGYKNLLKVIMNIDDQVFEMLYDDDISNYDEYEVNQDDLLDAYGKLKEIKKAG
ncbi:hypothetical protein [Staphylococcus epidermidis]|uniref:hypothetical protein n=1 Tax=Staphylococcus epidermidis TaxID=1282 RepID=UPI00138DDC2C